jgi:hypothetical protein
MSAPIAATAVAADIRKPLRICPPPSRVADLDVTDDVILLRTRVAVKRDEARRGDTPAFGWVPRSVVG